MISDEEIKKVLEKSQEARENAFVPRSGHKIGAGILTTDGYVFSGCNIESNISGLGICAERCAIDNAILHGKYEFKALLTVDEKLSLPCGVCLQYLLEFYFITESDISIVTADLNGNMKKYSLLQLLPYPYLPGHDLDKIKSYRNRK